MEKIDVPTYRLLYFKSIEKKNYQITSISIKSRKKYIYS